jgi:putative nucleotidyltransferase with HDIG domain
MNSIDSKKEQKSKPPQKWQKSVKQAMREATEKEAEQRYGTKKPSFNYRWEHVTAVVTLALKLANQTGADRDIVEAAAWLHDVRKDAKDRHPQEGAKFAKKLLQNTDFPPDKIKAVGRTIEDHMGLWRNKPLKMLESQVLWDADKLAKIGLTAVFHWIGGDLAKQRPRTTADILRLGKAIDWHDKTVAHASKRTKKCGFSLKQN